MEMFRCFGCNSKLQKSNLAPALISHRDTTVFSDSSIADDPPFRNFMS